MNRCPCAPDESGAIVHNRWWHDAHDPGFPPDPYTYATQEEVLRSLERMRSLERIRLACPAAGSLASTGDE